MTDTDKYLAEVRERAEVFSNTDKRAYKPDFYQANADCIRLVLLIAERDAEIAWLNCKLTVAEKENTRVTAIASTNQKQRKLAIEELQKIIYQSGESVDGNTRLRKQVEVARDALRMVTQCEGVVACETAAEALASLDRLEKE